MPVNPEEGQRRRTEVRQIIYASSLNAYFFCFKNHLYRKNIDSRSPRPVARINNYDLKYDLSLGIYRQLESYMKYSETTNRLFICLPDNILILNLLTSRIEIKIEIGTMLSKRDHKNFVLIESSDEPLKILEITNDCTKLAMSQVVRRGEEPLCTCDLPDLYEIYGYPYFDSKKITIRICDKNRYALLEILPIRESDDYCGSDYPTARYWIFELRANSIQLKSSVEFNGSYALSSQISYSSYVLKNHLIFVQLFFEEVKGWVQCGYQLVTKNFLGVVDYNIRTGELKLIKTELDVEDWDCCRVRTLKKGNRAYLVRVVWTGGRKGDQFEISELTNSILKI